MNNCWIKPIEYVHAKTTVCWPISFKIILQDWTLVSVRLLSSYFGGPNQLDFRPKLRSLYYFENRHNARSSKSAKIGLDFGCGPQLDNQMLYLVLINRGQSILMSFTNPWSWALSKIGHDFSNKGVQTWKLSIDHFYKTWPQTIIQKVF